MEAIALTFAQVEDFRAWADPNPEGVPLIREELYQAVSDLDREQMVDRVITTGRAHVVRT